MKERCEGNHPTRPVGAWLCVRDTDKETHVHVCGSHAHGLHSPSVQIIAIDRGAEYPHGVRSEGCTERTDIARKGSDSTDQGVKGE